ncbi:MAG: sugar transferase [Oscillospiraceae bacterium]|nr:sugar transferase [Oscillospiraceae bacterium]
MYAKFWKRVLDLCISAVALLVLSPVLLILILVGAVAMKGNPFFTQLRPGKDEKIFRLIKFRTMTMEKDSSGKLLPDARRLNGYGKFLRASSLDELPELINIFLGQMSLVGPRPLLVEYLPLYNAQQRHRHDVRPGLTGLAQVNGRNLLAWEDRFRMDVEYTKNITLLGDIKILLLTVKNVLKRDGISAEGHATMEPFRGSNKQE